MRLGSLILFCIVGGCFFVLGAYCRSPEEGGAREVVVVLPNREPIEGGPTFVPRRDVCDPAPRNERQVGTLSALKEGTSENHVLPLFANKSCANRDRYFYRSRTDGFNPVVVPVFLKGRNCMTDRIGCEALYDGDTVQVPALEEGKVFSVSLYEDLY